MAVLGVSLIEVIILLLEGDNLVFVQGEELVSGRVCTQVVHHPVFVLLVCDVIEDDAEAENISISVTVRS